LDPATPDGQFHGQGLTKFDQPIGFPVSNLASLRAAPSFTFVFSASKADRSRPMHINASETDADAVSGAHRRLDPGHRSDAR